MFKKITSFFYVLFLTLALTACGGNSPEKVAEKFMSYFYNGEIDKAFELMYIPESAQKDGSAEMVKGKLTMMMGEVKKEIDKNGGIKSITAETAQYSADKTKATVMVKVIFAKNLPEQKEKVNLRKDGSNWKVDFD